MLTSTHSTVAPVLHDKQFEQLCKLVYEHTGIKLGEAKRELVTRRFSPRLKKLGLQDFDEYLSLVRSGDQGELVEFTNAITTNLTSFFRENHHFDYLKNECLPKIVQQNKATRKLRIWSAGCSTGPEPYSIAMVLREAIPSIDAWDVKILATDIDTGCVATAANGIYTEKTVEGVSAERRKRWFDQDASSSEPMLQAKDSLKSLIRFNQLNLLTPFPFKQSFDVIFCRNVFIYFDKPTQEEVIRKFASYQKPGDILMIGHSENLHSIKAEYQLVGQTIYQKMG